MRKLGYRISKPTMGRKEGAKRIPEEKRKRICDMNVIGVRVRDIAKFYKMPRSTFSCIIRRYKMQTKTIKKQGHPKQLSERE